MVLDQESIRPSPPAVRTIYRITHCTLVDISIGRSDPKIARSASRLKLWGAGLFEMAVPLDLVFDRNKDAFRPVRQCILRILVDILVWEGGPRPMLACRQRAADPFLLEQELNTLSNDGQNLEQRRWRRSVEQIKALLGTGELLPVALECWKDSVDQHESVQADRAKTNYNPVPGLVEILFDLVPALRAARRTHCAEAELLGDDGAYAPPVQPAAVHSIGGTLSPTLSPQRSTIYTESTTHEQRTFDESYVDLANLKFDQANEILKELDEAARTTGSAAYATMLQTEKESMDRFHLDRKRRKDADPKDLEAMLRKQIQLVDKLCENRTPFKISHHEVTDYAS